MRKTSKISNNLECRKNKFSTVRRVTTLSVSLGQVKNDSCHTLTGTLCFRGVFNPCILLFLRRTYPPTANQWNPNWHFSVERTGTQARSWSLRLTLAPPTRRPRTVCWATMGYQASFKRYVVHMLSEGRSPLNVSRSTDGLSRLVFLCPFLSP